MSVQFSVESIEYLTEKLNNGRCLCDESVAYLTSQISRVIFDLLEDTCKFVRKCCRNEMIIDDFAFALKLNYIKPIHGYTTKNIDRSSSFRKIKKDNRILYHIDDNIVALNDLITSQVQVPFDLSIRAHWLAVNGQQPITNENPMVNASIRSVSKKVLNKSRKLLSMEQQIYYKELTEMCICLNEKKRKQALLILSSDSSLQQIVSRVIIFISEGVRVNLSPTSTFYRSIILNFLLQMCDALLQNENIILESYLHYLLPATLSCLLERRISCDHWSLRDLAGKCCGQMIRKFSTSTNRLQQRTVNIFYRILINSEEEYIWSTQYGAFVGLCEMSHKVIIQIVFPLIKQLGEKIRLISDRELSLQMTKVIVKFITIAYRSVQNDNESNEKKLYEDFGSYFAPLIQRQLILLLCGDMFENGSYLRRRKRFKLLNKSHTEHTVITKQTIKPTLVNTSSPIKSQPIKSSFFIDNLLANDTNTNTSYTTSSASSPSEANCTLKHLLYSTDLDLVQKLTFFNDFHGQQQQQQVYW
ncbi:unnamed protein product [Rotaria socialis]|uniref:TAF6 C-terminal HEAT repeat domain-containing protein n=1 Tax=Rotaria socialis TaxID=392032 RepID=A0A820W5D5_9BILA|nr:unnamed protein product [Rotaria socialis]